MKRFISILLVVTLCALTGCRKTTIIPDDTLAEIFHDAFVANAYIGEKRLNIDTLQIYEPIFQRYGYTAKDVVYTVGNFSRRKSARLGSVVEQAITRLEKENKEYARKVIILDTIRNVAVRTLTREVYRDTLITANKKADTTALQLEINSILPGEYTITYGYKCEGDMEKNTRRAEFYFEDENDMRNGYASVSLHQGGRVNRTIISRDRNKRLVLNLGTLKYEGKRYPKKHSIEIRNLSVAYKPQSEMAIDSLFARYVDIKIFADGFLIKEDSLALSPDTTRVSTPTAHND